MLAFVRNLFRPVCPACEGKGGEISGYYEPEFSECGCCYEDRWYGDSNPTRVWRWRRWTWRYQEWRTARHWESLYAEEERRCTDLRLRDLPDFYNIPDFPII